MNLTLSLYLKGLYPSVKIEPSNSNYYISDGIHNELLAKLKKNIKEDTINKVTHNKLTPRNNNNSNANINKNVIFPQIVLNKNKSLTKLNNNNIKYNPNSNELNDKDRENSTFQDTRSIDLIEKSGIYNTVKSEKSVKSISNNLNYTSIYNGISPPKKDKKHFNLYTNSNRGYNLAGNNINNPNSMGNTFITFPNQKLKRNDFLQKQQQSIQKEERLILKTCESNLNTTTYNNINNNNNNQNTSASLTASDKRELEQVIIKEKKNANDPLMSKQYYQISSFEDKLNSELSRLSRNYGKIDARGKFTNNLLEKYIEVIPDYDKYKIVKLLNNKENYKFRLSPMVIIKKNGFEKLGKKFFDNLKYYDPEYYDINKEWEEYLSKVKDLKIEKEKHLNSINFDFSKDYKKLYEEEQSNLNDNVDDIKYNQVGISSQRFFDPRDLKINKDPDIDINKIRVEKYNENEEEYKLV